MLQLLRSMLIFGDKHLAAAVLHPSCQKLTFAIAYSRALAYSWTCSEIAQSLGLHSEQETAPSEPTWKTYRSIEEQFHDPDGNSGTDASDTSGSTTLKNDFFLNEHS